MFSKVYPSSEKALAGVLKNGMTIMSGGFGVCGIPENLTRVIVDSKIKDLTIIANNCGINDFGLGELLSNGQIKKMVASFLGGNSDFDKFILNNQVELELIPQGTMAERIRAKGAGVPAFYTKTGVGTVAAAGKEIREFNDQKYVLEHALGADLAIVKGDIGDTIGNVIYNKTARNFNPIMAMAADLVVCEVEKLVSPGEIDPNYIHTPSIFVHRIIQGEKYEKRIERLKIKNEG